MDDQILHGLFQRGIYPLRLGPTARETLQEFIDIDATAEDMVRIFRQNPAYRHTLERFVSLKAPAALKADADTEAAANGDSQEKKDEEEKNKRPKHLTPTYRLISLLGLLGTRNFILALRIFKATTGKFPEEVKGKWNFAPPEYLKKCLEIEEFCFTHKLLYVETSYAAAYMYDWIGAMAKNHPQARALVPFVDQCWKTGQRAGVVAYGIAERYPNFAFLKFAMASGILHNVGRALMAVTFADATPSYVDFATRLDKVTGLPRLAYALQERAAFQVSANEVSSLAMRSFSVFNPIGQALHYQNEPYNLKPVDKNLYLLAATLQLSSAMASAWRIPTDDKDPLLKQWKRPWVKDLHLNEKKLGEIMKWAMTLKS